MAAVAVGARRPAVWFALLLPGVLAAGSLPVAALATPRPSSTGIFGAIDGATVTKELYLGEAPLGWPTGFPLGWYWIAALIACLLLTAAWYRRPKATSQPVSMHGYLVTGMALVVVSVALPLAGWTTLIGSYSLVSRWLDLLWQHGTLAQLAIAVTLGILARRLRSRALFVAAAIYAVAVCLAGWVTFQAEPFFDSDDGLFDPYVLPAAVLLLAGLGALIAARIRPRSGAVTSGPSAA